ncbi:hypothetical protein HDZ31DRAFT_62251 [Schizophyllum fasciatum]
MQFSVASLFAVVALLFAGQAIAISGSADDACNCPRSCGFTIGQECMWKDGEKVVHGKCADDGKGKGGKVCV